MTKHMARYFYSAQNFSCVLFSFQSDVQQQREGDQSIVGELVLQMFLHKKYLQERSQRTFVLFLRENVWFI